jgi:hypothetical protein
VVWDLKRQDKVSDAEAALAGVTTLSEREALDWVAPGDYLVTMEMGGNSPKTKVIVRKEGQGVKRVEVRK